MDYQHLTQNQRYQIQILFAEDFGPTAIGKRIGRHKSTISRELNRNSDEQGYRAAKAQNRYYLRLQAKGVERQPWRLVWNEWAVPLITEGWSPAQISGVFANSEYPVSHEWLYQRILADKRAGGTLYKHLRCQKLRKKRYGKPDRRGLLKNRVSISERPAEVETREEEGHWEADLVMGSAHQGALVTLVERKTGFMKTLAVPNKEAKGVTKAVIRMLKPLGDKVKSITFDNGKEFAGHEEIAKALNAKCYFADPYSSWQRGSNENTNGLIRQYYPKKNSNFSKVTRKEIVNLEKRLNNRPRKRLGFRSPAQVFNEGQSLN
ncbi:IS30 family transposase [uncultured Deefgea sp.]|uniref:IS30 family transposase n=1 Tax=uncultured Deefgea sp. TaxID=1304914 RepID=UPI0025981899|nr:IS30 family transposase [uncultured Deefgea sp.]